MDKVADITQTQMESHDKELTNKEPARDKKYPDYCRTMVIKGKDSTVKKKIFSDENMILEVLL